MSKLSPHPAANPLSTLPPELVARVAFLLVLAAIEDDVHASWSGGRGWPPIAARPLLAFSELSRYARAIVLDPSFDALLWCPACLRDFGFAWAPPQVFSDADDIAQDRDEFALSPRTRTWRGVYYNALRIMCGEVVRVVQPLRLDRWAFDPEWTTAVDAEDHEDDSSNAVEIDSDQMSSSSRSMDTFYEADDASVQELLAESELDLSELLPPGYVQCVRTETEPLWKTLSKSHEIRDPILSPRSTGDGWLATFYRDWAGGIRSKVSPDGRTTYRSLENGRVVGFFRAVDPAADTLFGDGQPQSAKSLKASAFSGCSTLLWAGNDSFLVTSVDVESGETTGVVHIQTSTGDGYHHDLDMAHIHAAAVHSVDRIVAVGEMDGILYLTYSLENRLAHTRLDAITAAMVQPDSPLILNNSESSSAAAIVRGAELSQLTAATLRCHRPTTDDRSADTSVCPVRCVGIAVLGRFAFLAMRTLRHEDGVIEPPAPLHAFFCIDLDYTPTTVDRRSHHIFFAAAAAAEPPPAPASQPTFGAAAAPTAPPPPAPLPRLASIVSVTLDAATLAATTSGASADDDGSCFPELAAGEPVLVDFHPDPFRVRALPRDGATTRFGDAGFLAYYGWRQYSADLEGHEDDGGERQTWNEFCPVMTVYVTRETAGDGAG
ncbi:hypothetical protein DFJ73DRAFT_931149 [Zopfochytrium polystomum]|nr:hypothetical protein DFJ73DRAFT_931149 [Zopfochytrium polystomum]